MANYATGPRRSNLGTGKNNALNITKRGPDKRSSLGGGTGTKAPEAHKAPGLRSNIQKSVKSGKVVGKALSKARAGDKTPSYDPSALAIAGNKSNANSFTQRVIKAIKNVRGNSNNNGGNYG